MSETDYENMSEEELIRELLKTDKKIEKKLKELNDLVKRRKDLPYIS